MSFWLVLWIVISVALLGFLGWSLFILYRQKAAWKSFALKYKLRYKSNSMMQSPDVEGSIDGYKVSLLVGEHASVDMRGMRKLSAIEVNLHSVLPIDCGVASGGMVPVIKEISFHAEIRPDHEQWDPAYLAAGTSASALKLYLNEERLAMLTKLMRIAGCWVVLIARKERLLLRVDTSNPLVSGDMLDRLVKAMLKTAKVLELGTGEGKLLQLEAERGEKTPSLVVEEKSLENASALVLEDEGGDQAEEDDLPEKPEIEKE